MEKLLYLINCMTQSMDRNISSESSAHLRLLVYYASQIISKNNSIVEKDINKTRFNKECEIAQKRNIWTPYKSWED